MLWLYYFLIPCPHFSWESPRGLTLGYVFVFCFLLFLLFLLICFLDVFVFTYSICQAGVRTKCLMQKSGNSDTDVFWVGRAASLALLSRPQRAGISRGSTKGGRNGTADRSGHKLQQRKSGQQPLRTSLGGQPPCFPSTVTASFAGQNHVYPPIPEP